MGSGEGETPEFVVFGIDPGRESGWAVTVDPDTVVLFGKATCSAHRKAAVEDAQELAVARNRPLVVVGETWTAGGWQHYKALLGLGASWGRWLEALELAGISEDRIVRATPQKWRGALFRRSSIKKDEAKQLAMTYASHTDPDVAEAICIALWGQCSEECIDMAVKLVRTSRT